MANYTASGVHLINRYALDKLDAAGIMSKAGYKINLATVSPFIPSQQVPELMKLNQPFVVYNYQSTPDNDLWIAPLDQAVYVIYSQDEETLRKIYNFMIQLLNRQDTTRNELNDYIDHLPNSSVFNGWEFKSIEVISATGPDPYTQEGGVQSATIVCRFRYSVPLDSTTYMRL